MKPNPPPPSRRRWRPLLLALLAGQANVAVVAQRAPDDALRTARTIVDALAPATDAATPAIEALLDAALAMPRSPLAALLADEALRVVSLLPEPLPLRDRLRARSAELSDACHGLLQQSLRELDHALLRAGAGPAAAMAADAPDPFPDHARSLLVVGPFGDAGNHHLAVEFPPDRRFPARGERLDGRFGPVTPRVVRRPAHEAFVHLPRRNQPHDGCWFALQRIQVDADCHGFVEIACGGDWLCRLDGHELARREPWLRPEPRLLRIAVRLSPGEHHLVVKTGTNGEHEVAIRWIDAAGAPLRTVRELPADGAAAGPGTPTAAVDPRDAARFRCGRTLLEQAFAAHRGEDLALLRVAATVAAERAGDLDSSFRWLMALQDEPPGDPAAALVFAGLLRGFDALPEEQRNAAARELENRALTALPDGHHTALLVKVRHLQGQDQGETALHLLRQQVAAGRAGPETFALLSELVRRLRFHAEEVPVLLQWRQQCPNDLRPRLQLAERQRDLGDPRGALRLILEALAIRPDGQRSRSLALAQAIALGETAIARAQIEQLAPPPLPGELPSVLRLQYLATLALAAGDAAATELLREIDSHPDADTDALRFCTERWLRLGDVERATATVRRSLELDPDQPRQRDLLARLGVAAADGAALVSFRRDGDAAIAAFRPSDRDTTAPTTALIDQQLVEQHADGSWLTEVHELRRINDQAGVDAIRPPAALQDAELLLLRTVGTDGTTWIPSRVEDGFALPRLEPGAFVEWRYRLRGHAPGPDALQAVQFLLRSAAEPLMLSELVLLLPAGSRGEVRHRNLDGPTEQRRLEDGRRVLVFRQQDMARLPDERLLPAAERLVPVVALGEDQSPLPHLRDLRVGLLRRTLPTPPIQALAQRLFAGVDSDRAKLTTAAAWCANELQGGGSSDATEALLRKKGNRFLLLVALLRAGGVPVEPAACRRTRPELGDDDANLFAAGDSHDLPAALVEPRDGPPCWLFADAPRHLPPGAVPAERAGDDAFVLRGDGPQLARLPIDADGAAQSFVVAVAARLSPTTMTADATLHVHGAPGYALAEQLREQKTDVQRLAARQICSRMFPDWRMQQAAPANLEPSGQPLVLQAQLRRTGPQQHGDRWLLPLPLPPGRFQNAFGDRAGRSMPLRLAAELRSEWRVAVDLGDEFDVDALPPPLLVLHGPLAYRLSCRFAGNTLHIERSMRLRPAVLSAADCADWQRVLVAIDRAEAQNIELRRRPR